MNILNWVLDKISHARGDLDNRYLWVALIKKFTIMFRLAPVDTFSDDHWRLLLWNRYCFIDQAPHHIFSGWTWTSLMTTHPEHIKHLCKIVDWDTIQPEDWCYLLQSHPQLEHRCSCWHQFTNIEWVDLLIEQPQFAWRCDLSKFSVEHWQLLGDDQPTFTNHPLYKMVMI